MHQLIQRHRASAAAMLASILFVAASITTISLGVFTTASTASDTQAPACKTSNLDIWLRTEGSGAAGSSYYDLEFTNLGQIACSIQGYPAISAIALSGIQVGHVATHNSNQAAKLITITSAHGARAFTTTTKSSTATAVVQIVDAENFPNNKCHEVTSAGLRIYPPNQSASAFVPFPFVACSKTGVTFLSVSPIQKYSTTP